MPQHNVGTRKTLRPARRVAEEAIARMQAKERIALMLDATPLACFLLDKDYKILDCNQEAARLFGLNNKQDFRERFRELSPEYQPNGQLSAELAAQYTRRAYEEGKYVFEWMHRTFDGMLLPAEITLIRVDIASSGYTVLGYARDLREQKRMMAEIEKRDVLLQTVNRAANILLQSESRSFDAAMLRCIGMIGKAVEADRVSIWRNYFQDNKLHCTQLYEWISSESQVNKSTLVDIAYDLLTGWEKTLSKGDCISVRISDMSLAEQAQLSQDGILSLFVVPVFTQEDRFWGFVCFDNCSDERLYSATEQSILRSGSLLIAHSFVRHEMHTNLRETTARLQTVLANHPGIIWFVDKEGMITLFNGMLLAKLGIAPDRVAGKTLHDLPHSLMHSELIDYIRKTFTEGAQEWITENQGFYHMNTSPVYGNDGNVTNVVGSADEITEIIRLQDDLKVALDKANDASILKNIAVNALESILNSIDAMIYTTVPETGEILFVNKYMQMLLEKTNDDLIGQYCYQAFRGLDTFCDFCPCYQLNDAPEAQIIWDEYISDIGRHIRHSDWYIDWPDGKKVHLQHAVDISELVRARESAEHSNRSKGVFIAQMSHEIRTPISAILGISEIQLRDERLSAGAEEGFRKIYDSGNLLLNIIDDILDFSKIDAGKMDLVAHQYDLPSLINDSVQLCRLRFESKPIAFNLHIGENTPLELIGDELRIRQILNNLLSNAFKYTDTGEVRLSVAVEAKSLEEIVILVLRVDDTGQGMTQEQIARIFDEYSRFNMEKNSGIPGTGLGMNITKRLIDLMGGEISVESEIDKGSAFTVRLPQKSCGAPVCDADIVESLRNFSFYNPTIAKKSQIAHEYMPYGRVLIVDDVEANLYVAKGLMMPYGLHIETAKSGFEAVKKIRDGNVYDIVFMDHMMPMMDGIQAAKILRNSGYTHPLVMLTANAILGQAEMFLSHGFDRFISKPIDSRELDRVLTELIRDRKAPEIVKTARRKRHKADTAPKNDLTELEKYFVRDAEGILVVLDKISAKIDSLDDTDIESYTIAVHGIKSALANIGETKLSECALALEKAGAARNFNVIAGDTPAFIKKLASLTAKLRQKELCGTVESSRDDLPYLKEKLSEFRTACETFHIRAAETVLADLTQKTWPQEIDDALSEISVSLLRGEFKKALSLAEKMTNTPDA